MLYETLNQPLVIISVLLAGIASGILFDISAFLSYLFNKNQVARQILYFFNVLVSSTLLFYVNLKTNFGQARLYIPLLFILAIFIERLTLGKGWTKLLEKCYNKIEKFRKRVIEKLGSRRKKKETDKS